MFGLSFLTPKVMEYVGIALLIAAYTGWIFYEGGVGPRAKYVQLEANIKAAELAHEKLDKAAADAGKLALTNLESRHAIDSANSESSWLSYIAGLSKPGSVAGRNPKPVRESTGICGNANDSGLSDAIYEYRTIVANALQRIEEGDARRRLETAGSLKVCQSQALDLKEWKEFGLTLRTINSLGTKP